MAPVRKNSRGISERTRLTDQRSNRLPQLVLRKITENFVNQSYPKLDSNCKKTMVKIYSDQYLNYGEKCFEAIKVLQDALKNAGEPQAAQIMKYLQATMGNSSKFVERNSAESYRRKIKP